MFPPWFSQSNGPKPNRLQLLCVFRLGSRGIEQLLSLQLPTMCNGSSPPPPPKRPLQLATRSSQTMKEFWFFNFSSSLICCLRNSILWKKAKESIIICACSWIYLTFLSLEACTCRHVFSPLLTQCCLYFTDSDQGPEVFQLSAVLRHTDAPHGVSLFT